MCFTAILINYLKIDLNFKKSNYTFKQFIQYQTDATRKAAEIIEKSKVRRSDTTSKKILVDHTISDFEIDYRKD